MHISKAFEKMKEINSDIKALMKEIEYPTYEDLSGLDYDNENPEDQLLRSEMRSAADQLDRYSDILNYLSRNVIETSTLFRNARDRYETVSGTREYTCGSKIEYLYYDNTDEKVKWEISSVEYSDGDYYIVGNKNLPLEGLKVRIRETANWF